MNRLRIVGISRVIAECPCESCDRPARFRFQYNFSESGGELILCDYHLQDLLCGDAALMADLVGRLHEMLDPVGSPLLLP